MPNLIFFKIWINEWRSYLVEFIATLIFVFICQLLVVSNFLYGSIGNIETALAIGFSYTALIFATNHLSGGFLNPAVVVCLWIVQKISSTKALSFIICQIMAGFAASFLVIVVFGQDSYAANFGIVTLGSNVSLKAALFIEAIFTAGLIFSIFATFFDRRGPISFGPLTVGLFLTSATIAAMSISGGVFNPARIIGASVISGSYELLAVFVIGPLLGGLFGVVYDLLILLQNKKK